jgi:Zn-dependent metalloprotease
MVVLLAVPVAAAPKTDKDHGRAHRDAAAVARLKAESGDAAEVSVSPATATASFVKLRPGRNGALDRGSNRSAKDKKGRALGFLKAHGKVFGLVSPDTDLVLTDEIVDKGGYTHLTYAQNHRGVPVFAGTLRVHFDAADDLVAVNGTIVPDLALDPTPSVDVEAASGAAIAVVSGDAAAGVSVKSSRLVVFREGLAKGVLGDNHLAWQLEVGDGAEVREFVFIDAHSGKLIDRIAGVYDAMNRRAYDGRNLPQAQIPTFYPQTPYWVEGQPFPTASTEANNMIIASKETYDIFSNAFGRDSFDGTGATMDAIFNRGYSCPNASWNGTFISFCAGMTSDDVTGHEWVHAYTQYTHDLIYQWQSGALNESYSDIFGEAIDLINGRGTDTPGGNRSADGASCSDYTPFPPSLRVNSPAAIAGVYGAGRALFGPALTNTGVTADLVLANDGSTTSILVAQPNTAGTVNDGCQPFVNAAAVAGKVALVERGGCGFKLKAYNAQNAGAIGTIIHNIASSANALTNMSDDPAVPNVTIPSINILFSLGTSIRTQMTAGNTVNGSLRLNAPAGVYDDSYRWLVGEDDTAVGLAGALRDMWRPVCQGNPGKVSDPEYGCSTADQGGVHDNSGVPNHAFALIVDGGTYNGQTISGIGLTKALHIYYRAMTVYQHPASNFIDHADAIEQSAADLLGTVLADLSTGAPSGHVITAADIAQIEKAMLAVEMRTPPTQCNFQPLLKQNAPDRCEVGTTQVNVFAADFETDPGAAWTVSHQAVVPADFTPREWVWANSLPDDREGSAFFAIDPVYGSCAPGGDESGVLHLDSPSITLPSGVSDPRLSFDHWIASEAGFDGGNVRISVNGGAWALVAAADFTFNPYNATLASAGAGNTNPMAGQAAFTGTDGGAVDGTWGRSHVKLGAYADAGDTVRLRFDFGVDGCGGAFGWYLDDVTVHACTSNAAPTVSIGDVTVVEGSVADHTPVSFKVTLSHPSAEPVVVRYNTADGTAKQGTDYSPVNGSDHFLTIPPLSISGTVSTRVKADTKKELAEVFTMNLTAVSNSVIGDGAGVCTIQDDDTTP